MLSLPATSGSRINRQSFYRPLYEFDLRASNMIPPLILVVNSAMDRRPFRVLALAAYLTLAAAAKPLTAQLNACPRQHPGVLHSWGPLPWREPFALCECPPETSCRGGFCETGRFGRQGYVAGCSTCTCLPLCSPPTRCGQVALECGGCGGTDLL